jgi:hypothetical protein
MDFQRRRRLLYIFSTAAQLRCAISVRRQASRSRGWSQEYSLGDIPPGSKMEVVRWAISSRGQVQFGNV